MNKIIPLAFLCLIIIGGIVFFSQKNNSSSLQKTNQPNQTQSTKSYSLADVSTHKDNSSCWTVINGNVYDLTSWINNHPGGPENILAICGTDGSSAFNAQHGGQSRPENQLSEFLIGSVKN